VCPSGRTCVISIDLFGLKEKIFALDRHIGWATAAVAVRATGGEVASEKRQAHRGDRQLDASLIPKAKDQSLSYIRMYKFLWLHILIPLLNLGGCIWGSMADDEVWRRVESRPATWSLSESHSRPK